MPIHRTNKKESGHFFVAPNQIFNDSRLSWEARGVMGYLLSKPNKWIVREQDLIKQASAGKHKIKKILAELKENGYVRKSRYRNDQGRFEWITDIYDTAQDQLLPTPRKSDHGEQTTTRKSGDGPLSDSPVTDTKGVGESGHIVNSDKLLNALNEISKQMPKPLQSPQSLAKSLLARGETNDSVTNAWKTCQTNGYKPAGAFICWIKSGYLPQTSTTSGGQNSPPDGPDPEATPTPRPKRAQKSRELTWDK